MTPLRVTDTGMVYDPDADQCPTPPSHGWQRAGIMWYGDATFLCPKCYENILGGPPAPGQVVDLEPKAER